VIQHKFGDKIKGWKRWNINKQSRSSKGNSAPEVTCTHIDLSVSVHEYQRLGPDHDVEEQEYQPTRSDCDLEEDEN